MIGAVTFGFPLDDRVAQGLARITRAEINLVSGNHLAGSSLAPDEQKQLSAALAAGSLASADALSSEVETHRRRDSSSEVRFRSSAIGADR